MLGHVDLPTPFAPNRQSFQREVVRSLERVRLGPRDEQRREQFVHDAAGDGGDGGHAIERDPDLAERLVAAAQAERLGRDVDELKLRVKGRSQSIARQFDRVLRILEGWGYVDGWRLTRCRRLPRPHVPRVRSAGRRMPDRGPARRSRTSGVGRSRLGLHLRAPHCGTSARAVVSVAHGAQAMAADQRHQRRVAG